MPIGHNQVYLRGSTGADVLQETTPSIFVFLCTGSQCEHIFVSFQVHTERS
jgi:hypothetical protein